MEKKKILEMRDISKSFFGNIVLNNVQFDMNEGEVHALIGANGAGKSTLVKILNGIYNADSGEIFIDGKKANIRFSEDAEKYGIAFVHQELNICPDLNVAENIFVGNLVCNRFGIYDPRATIRKAQELIDMIQVDMKATDLVRNLRAAEKQIIEILKALTRNARILVLDEPTSSLNEKEKEIFFGIIERLKKQGVTVLFISHFLEDILAISDRISVLILIIIVFVVAMSIASPYFLKVSNLLNIIQYVSVYGITAIGMTMVILTGGINLSVGGTLALSAWVASRCMLDGIPWGIAIVFALIVGAAVGLINGFAVSVIRIPPLIATLAMEQITRGLHMVLSNGKPLYGFDKTFLSVLAGNLFGIPKAVVWTILLFVAFGLFLSRTRMGRRIYAVGGNPAATRIAGVNNTRVMTVVYTLAGVLCAFAGLTLIARMDSIPVTIASGLDMSAITACVIGGASVTCGGKGRVFGTFLGILIMGLIQNSLDLLNVSPYYQKLIQGLVIFGAVMLDAMRNTRSLRSNSRALSK